VRSMASCGDQMAIYVAYVGGGWRVFPY